MEQTSITANLFHNTTAHFNGYFYAKEKAAEVEKTILKSLDDDHNLILRLFPKIDTVLAKSYEKDTEDIIKMASISIQRHPNSKWVYENYILVGRARMYDCEFVDAIQTFKFVNTKSRSSNLRHQALIYLVRTFTEHEEYEKAEEAFMFLEKEDLNKLNRKNLYLEKAYYYQVRNDYDKMVRNLAHADSLLTKTDRKARIYFIIGQVYQQLGFGAEAYNYYRKVLSASPEYEIDFYARLNMAQVARLDNQRDVKTIRRQFTKLLADGKNAEFKDKIYYELGEFERKQNHLPEAIDNYKLAAHAGKNKRIQGSAFLRVGQLYFDSLKKYDQAKLYYDSAVQTLPKEFENYAQIKIRQEVLGDFAKYNETISWQDSLLAMAAIDTATLRKSLDSTLTERALRAQVKTKKRRFGLGGGGGAGGSNSLLNLGESTATSNWYFDNPSAVGSGETEFQRIWGNVALEDNWRRSNKSTQMQSLPGDATAENANAAPGEVKPLAAPIDPKVAEIKKVFAELPYTDEQKKASLSLIEEAYFQLGDLYFIKLNEKANASTSYTALLERFPRSEHTPEVLYKLYLIEKEKTDGDPDRYATLLTSNYPNSTFTRVLLNPDYLKETSVTTEKQKLIYKDAYEAYRNGNLRDAQEQTTQAIALGETGFTPQLQLLRILIMGKTEDVTQYQFELEEFIKKYEGPMKIYAQTLLDASKTFLQKVEKAKGIRFVNEADIPHYYVIVYRIADKLANNITAEIEQFNRSQARDKKLETSNLTLNENYTLTMVTELKDRAAALEYFDKLNSWLAQRPSLATYKFDTFVITKDNFQIFYRTKALDEYLTFYDRNYKAQNQ